MSNRLQQGLEFQRANKFKEAAAAYRDVLKKNPKHPDAMHFLGLALWNITEKSEEPLRLIRRSMELAPNQPQMHHNIASVVSSIGQIDEAVGHYRRAIELKPAYAEAFFNLGGIYKFNSDDKEIAAMKALYASASYELSDIDMEYLCFALSKAMNDIGSFDEAFHFALEAAKLKPIKHDVKKTAKTLVELRRTMSKAALAPKSGRGNNSQAPIFIVGMPRSGTTLVEQILSRHSQVFAAGELPMIGSINSQMRRWAQQNMGYKGSIYGHLLKMPEDHFANAAQACLAMIDERADGKKYLRFTDKMPQNAFQLGFISLLFPNARIIHVKRHPVDTCISCFFQRFRIGHEYSYRLDWLGDYYRFYANTMKRWHKVLPLPILDVTYEDLVCEPEEQARRLVDFAGLEWQDSCLKPQEANRSVLTASRWQVRQPIYKTSIDRWKRYEAYLPPLIEALGGWDWIKTV
jgi:tetratricopeptide (TPR) repeat protein